MAVGFKRNNLKFLGTIRGTGAILAGSAKETVGQVDYEIDCYRDGARHYGTGRIDGAPADLERAFRTGETQIALPDGLSVDIVLTDPDGRADSDITVDGRVSEAFA